MKILIFYFLIQLNSQKFLSDWILEGSDDNMKFYTIQYKYDQNFEPFDGKERYNCEETCYYSILRFKKELNDKRVFPFLRLGSIEFYGNTV